MIAEELHELFSWNQEDDRGSRGSGSGSGAGLPHHLEKADVRPDQSFLPHTQISPTYHSSKHISLSFIFAV
jgi:hypothetical protein